MSSDHPGSRARSTFVLVLSILLTAALVALFTIALRNLFHEESNWIGLTTLAGAALGTAPGIIALLNFQARATKVEREEARRIAIAELLKMAMDDPDLDEAWGPVPAREDRKTRRQLMYINMIVSEWQMSFETKALPESRLRAISREMFSGRPGRTYWQDARQVRIDTSETKQARRFHQILDEEYNQTTAPPPDNPGSRR
ncbi:hypothetical protein BJF79_12520 [Actinomadura sp. CNU-125]|uniref:DUF6082 family protein n=1 Tax=Actinomadura sp. CNU-125 TaxID=1904961 RepID=UPI0009680F46|nr:DUF6082 family protein [Actinomadura sp. CNU-125]OLT25943.1 hypothetical protein BJF79_12520 [Actinomadura sp. CNU-125]